MTMYYVFTLGEDGDVSVEELTQVNLLEQLIPDEDDYREMKSENILSLIPCMNMLHWVGESVLIIKGKIVEPKTKQIVTEYTIE